MTSRRVWLSVAVLLTLAGVLWVTPAVVNWDDEPCLSSAGFPGRPEIDARLGDLVGGCFYMRDSAAGAVVTVAYSSQVHDLPGDLRVARQIDNVLWQLLPYPIARIDQYPNVAFGEAAVDHISATVDELRTALGPRPASLVLRANPPRPTGDVVGMWSRPLALLLALAAAVLAVLWLRRRRATPAINH